MNKIFSHKYFKPLLVAGTAILSFFVYQKVAKAKTPKIPNANPFKGQMFTFSEAFDNAVMGISKRTGIPFNILMFNMWCESGIHAQAHVNYPDKKGEQYKYGLHDRESIGERTHGGGLFGLIRKYADSYIPKGMSFEDWLQSDEMDQLITFEKWIGNRGHLIKTPAEMRTLGFGPKYLGKSKDTVMYDSGDAYSAHAHLDIDGDHAITLGEYEIISTNKWNKLVDEVEKKGAPLQSKYGAN